MDTIAEQRTLAAAGFLWNHLVVHADTPDDSGDLGTFQRIPGREAQLTSRIAALCADDRALTRGVARALLATADASGVLNDRVPPDVVLLNEVNLGPKKDGRWRKSGGRVDWVLSGTGFCVLVEVKIGAAVASGQLERYLSHDAFTKTTDGGLMLLTRHRVDVPAKVWQHARWLGQVSWEEVLPQLQQVTASAGPVQKRWAALLVELARPGDLAAHPVGWKLEGRTAGQRNAAILRAVGDAACQVVARELGARKGFVRLDGLCGHKPPGGGRAVVVDHALAGLNLYIPSTKPGPVVTVDLVGTRRPLTLTTAAALPLWRLGQARKRQPLIQRLEAAGFTVDGEACSMTTRIRPAPGVVPVEPPTAVVRAVLERHLAALVGTGVLDQYTA